MSSFIKQNDRYLIDGIAINGVSGGPVFTNDDEQVVVGIISSYISNKVGGNTLPGLLVAQDISHFYDTLKTFDSFDDAIEKENNNQSTQ